MVKCFIWVKPQLLHVEMEKPGSGEVCCLPRVTPGHGGADANSVGLTLGPPSRQGLQSGGLSCRAEHPNPISARQDANPSPCHPPSSAKLPSRPRLSHEGSSARVPFWIHSSAFRADNSMPGQRKFRPWGRRCRAGAGTARKNPASFCLCFPPSSATDRACRLMSARGLFPSQRDGP